MTVATESKNMSTGARIRLAILLATSILVRQCLSQVQFTVSTQDVLNKCGVVQVAGSYAPIGSGFVFGTENDVVTCWHVKFISETIFRQTNLLVLSGMDHYDLKLKYMLPKYDLAVFSCPPDFKQGHWKAGDFKRLRPGDTIGYERFDVRESSQYNKATIVKTAQITAIGSALNDGVVVDFLEFQGEGIPGYSGGAVFNPNGELVAIMREAWKKKAGVGDQEVLINRAFSVEILSVLDGQIYRGGPVGSANTNGTQIGVTEILSLTNK